MTGALISATTYVLYIAIGFVQMGLGLLPAPVAWALSLAAAAINVGFYAAVRSGRVKRGDTVMLEGVGGGFTWGAVLLDF